MADFQQTMDVPGGKFSIAMKGGVVSTRIEKGEAKFEESTAALPSHKDIFNRLGPKDKLEKGDVIVISYKDGPGYAEVVTSADGKSIKAVGPKGDERTRDHLLANSSYDAATGTFSYNGTWDARYSGMTFQIIRSKSGTAPVQTTNTSPVEAPTNNGRTNRNNNDVTGGRNPGQSGAGDKLAKEKIEFDKHLTAGMKEFNDLYASVELKRGNLAKTDPNVTTSGWDKGTESFKRAEREWNASGKVKLQSLVEEQKMLSEKYKTFEKELKEAQTYRKKEEIVAGLRSFVQEKNRTLSASN